MVEALGGTVVGEVFEGQARFPLQVRFGSETRADLEGVGGIRVATSGGRVLPLSQLADIRVEEGPAQISRERIQRRLTVEANVRGRDLGSFAADVQTAVAAGVDLPPGYSLEYGGQFENLERASRRLALVVPLALFLIFLLLYTAFGAVRPALLIYFNIPIAATGGILALFVRGMPFSISAGIGFIALSGVAVLNGVVMLSHVRDLQQQGLPVEEAVRQGAERRMRPVLMTALVASLGFVPLALATSAGRRGAAPPGDSGHRRPDDLDAADVVRAAVALPPERVPRLGGRPRPARLALAGTLAAVAPKRMTREPRRGMMRGAA